jgi:predicted nucleotidyltransferase component of viral defense system
LKKKPKDMAASVRDRLYNLAQREKRDFNLILTAFATERLLYRLTCSEYADRFVLKGARLFALWTDKPHRPTRDLDLLGCGDASPEALRRAFETICRTQVEPDGLSFDETAMTVEEIRLDQEYGGQRIKLTAHLAQARIPMQIDVGFGDVVTPEAQLLDYTPLLDALPTPRIRAYSRETVLAEKLHDIWTLANGFDYDGQTLCRAIHATFHRRRTPVPSELPLSLENSFAEDEDRKRLWKGFLKRSAIEDSASDDFAVVLGKVRNFLGPPLLAAHQDEPSFAMTWRFAKGRWDPVNEK